MRQQVFYSGLMSVVLTLFGACDSPVEEVTARGESTGNGCSVWRCGFNAAEVNGRSLQELHLGGLPNGDGVRIIGFLPPPLVLLGGYTLGVEGDELVARRGASKLARQQLIGSIILVQTPLGLPVPVTISGYESVPSWADGGEVRGGVSLPLWQGGAIDRRRADISVATLARDAAAAELDARAIELERAAGRAYWAWVGAGLRLEVQRALLKLAQDRDEALRKQIVAGGVPPVEGIDNRRAIVDRGARIIAGERALQQAAFDLARHLRDASGEVQAPAPSRLPDAFPEPQRPTAEVSESMIREAWARRPDLRRLMLQRDAAAVELKLARNNRSPRIDVDAYGAKDIGAVDPAYAYLKPAEFVAAVSVELPLALRGARGKLRRAEAELARIDAELRMARDVITLELRDAHSALVAAHARVALAREQLTAAHELELAERSRFRLGDSTLLLVNLREQAATDAALQELEALGEYHRAQVDMRAAAGLFGP